uniref:Uncharacterized protein n=1 Tax=Utricularia reniformis TaxID=192314 RepID=A0A1Y0B2K5_9LAMI|nr:hypothetical protein AEK19_MT1438 [Utricularia reniformis]ART31631.1 hypothetical protein AEK19_MT1438 [Utricularia reniformis]
MPHSKIVGQSSHKENRSISVDEEEKDFTVALAGKRVPDSDGLTWEAELSYYLSNRWEGMKGLLLYRSHTPSRPSLIRESARGITK